MNFIEELRWRGMLNDMTPGIEEVLESKKIVGYIGFDPTAPSLTIGNYVQIQILKFFQLSGHTPIILLGGATGRIGDPSGKDKERELKSTDELDKNLAFQLEQFKLFLDFEGPNAAIIVNNYDFYKDMNILEFLRLVGKTLTVNYMMSKDSVKNRLETGLSFTEFSYQLLQAYDYQCLYEKYGCILQMGGSDQWGNITSGTEFIRRNSEGKAYAVTTPLLTKADGKKFGKSEQGNVWIDPKLTTPYQFYQFWLNADDADLAKYLRYLSLRSKEEIESLERDLADNPNELKRLLAEELTIRVHGKEALDSVVEVTNILFNRNADESQLKSLSADQLETIQQEVTSFEFGAQNLPINIIDLLTEHCAVFTSKSEARRAIQNNALTLNKLKVVDADFVISASELMHGKFLMLENGKKNKHILRAL
ncbi:MAG TPA: tyrosine--tRNA ligase [Saprospiraceae bacterium]|nr:tyrosine--tRNA ligase [Saprospiraceae bacterium]HPN72095.1 tyrosine--tRNA ligase [Saprospiraceae bacterium]